MFCFKTRLKLQKLCVNFGERIKDRTFFNVGKNLQNTFTANPGNVHHLVEDERVMFKNSFCAIAVSGGLATIVTLTRVARGEVRRVGYMKAELLTI